AARLRDLLEHDGELRKEEVGILKLGRHFRLSAKAKVVVGRDEHENRKLGNELRSGDHALEISGQPGPLTMVRGDAGEEELAVAASITSRYGKSGGRSATTVLCRRVGDGAMVSIRVGPVDRESVRSKMIGANCQSDE
ncbi:MAG: hypothetical protein KAS89_06065, partial [Candidatus Eisenbacteria sp.]|nr:hypothetical protein [Candidatus Eisenbacteria bacterium]